MINQLTNARVVTAHAPNRRNSLTAPARTNFEIISHPTAFDFPIPTRLLSDPMVKFIRPTPTGFSHSDPTPTREILGRSGYRDFSPDP